MEALSLEEEADDDGEDSQGDDFLNNFQLHERERSSVTDKTNTVGGYSEAVFDKGDAPREGDDTNQRPVAADAGFL